MPVSSGVNVPDCPISIVYKTFIAPEVITAPANPLLDDYFRGDDRWFGDSGSSRSSQSTTVTLDPSSATGQYDTPSQLFGSTVGYDEESDVTPCTHCAPPYGDWCLVTGATPGCSKVANPGQNGNVLSVVHPPRVSDTEIMVLIDVVGFNPCGHVGVPGIDAHLTIHFRLVNPNGAEFRLYGSHDGFPWHELYINGVLVYKHDPCCTQEGPWSLPGSGEWFYKPKDENDQCHIPITGTPLDQWQPVPDKEP